MAARNLRLSLFTDTSVCLCFSFSSLKKKKKKIKHEHLGFVDTAEQSVVLCARLGWIVDFHPWYEFLSLFRRLVLLSADFTTVISVSGITVVGVWRDRAECTTLEGSGLFSAGVVGKPPRGAANWNSFLISSCSSLARAVEFPQRKVMWEQ